MTSMTNAWPLSWAEIRRGDAVRFQFGGKAFNGIASQKFGNDEKPLPSHAVVFDGFFALTPGTRLRDWAWLVDVDDTQYLVPQSAFRSASRAKPRSEPAFALVAVGA